MTPIKATNITWHEGHVTREERGALLGQQGATLWFTGLSGSGKSTIAFTLEHALIQRSRLAYVLDGDNIRHGLNKNLGFSATDREAIIRARRGQGLFKQRVMEIEQGCRITGVTNPVHLIGSHCKPWRDCTNEERLDGENGLLLTPSIDHLFDRGFIGFEGNGTLIISPVAHTSSLERMGIDTRGTVNVGRFTTGQKRFLEFHRDMVLLKAAR